MTEPSHLFDGVFLHSRRHPDHGICLTPVPMHENQGAFFEDTGWASVHAAIDSLAQELLEAGVVRGDRIAWIGPNDAMQIVLLAACSRLGAIHVPLNWRLSVEELRQIEQDAGFGRLAVPESKCRPDRFAHPYVDDFRARHPKPGIDVGDPFDWERGSLRPDDGPYPAPRELPHPPPPDAPLLICYTSGTTGRPKGAVHTQAGMRAHAAMAQALFGFTPFDTVMTVLPMFHVGGLCIQTIPALLAGADIILHARFDANEVFDSLRDHRPTLTLLVPAIMRALVDHPRWPDADLSCLRAIGAGSSQVPLDLIEAFHAKGVPVQQVYGATETGPIAIAQTREEALAAPGSIGLPVPGVEARLAPGTNEIMLRGPQIMRGYWNRTDGLTADGWFATGDVGRVDEHGRWWFTDRLKHVIISGGENIYPAEVERVLATAPGVAECAVIGRPDPRWGEVPVAVVVPAAGFEAARVLAEAAAGAVAAGFAPAVRFHDNRDRKPHQRPQIGHAAAIGAQDLHGLPFAGDAGHHLLHPGIPAARIGIHLGQQRGLGGEIHRVERVEIGIELRVGGARRDIQRAGMAGGHRPDRLGRAHQRRLRQLGGMRVAGGLPGHGAQAEAAHRIEAGGADAAILQADRLALPMFEEQFAILGTGRGRPGRALGRGAIQAGEEQGVGGSQRIGHHHAP
ncbi:AMP-binding protein [Leptolyngbya sp. 15MV]|nr:AMP-binding protein [Leptolyngbya sp. 15MV]